MDYPLTSSPFSIGSCELRNRVVRTAHGTGYTDGNVTDRLVAFHEARAKGGIALTILETSAVHPSSPSSMAAWRDEIVPGWARLAESVHRHGMKIFPQIWHGGAHVRPLDGGASWAPSSLPEPAFGRVPLAMTQAMIDELVESFAAGARRAQEAGLDGVEVHGGHEYLVSQFLSPLANLRDDDYGGSIENRARFAREILAAIRREVGPDFPVGIRISASDGLAGGIDVEEAIAAAEILEADGNLSFLDVSLGGMHNPALLVGAMHEPHGYELPSTAPVADAVELPTIVAGRFLSLDEVEQVLAAGTADLVSMVRATIADPDLVAKTLAGRASEVRPCIGCNEGCVGQRNASGASDGTVGCTVNAEAGLEFRLRLQPAPRARRVLVAGAGPAGLEAARVAATRGHRVEVHEAAASVGGLVNASRAAPYRDDIGTICDYLERELRRLGVELHLGSRLDLGAVQALQPDVVITATGASPRRDGIQRLRPELRPAGLDLSHVVDPVQVLFEGAGRGARRALVFDDLGHYPAIGVAEHLLERGTHVTFATSQPTLAPELVRSFQHDPVARRLASYETFELITRAALIGVGEEEVTLQNIDSDRDQSVPADLVVLVTGFESERELHERLVEAGIESILAGDALAPLLMQRAIASGYAAGAAV